MNNKKLRLIALMMVLAMTVTAALTGCNGSGGDSSSSGDYVMDGVLNPLGSEYICKEPVELKVMMGQSGQVTDYDTNKYTLEIERKGNVDLKFDLLPSADSSTKINLTLSSGTNLPDVLIAGLDDASVATYGEAGTFIPLNIYYENSSEYLVPQMEKLKEDTGLDIYDYITNSDGNIYAIPSYNESLQNEWPTLLWVYQPWLDKLGMEVPTNLDEFVTVLKAFRDNDMNGNGNKNDELPLIDHATGGMMEVLENAFVKTGVEQITIKEDGSLDMAYATDEYKEFLKFMKSLYDEGLLDKTTFSQDNATLKTLLNGEVVRVGVFAGTSTSALTAGTPRRENQEYSPVVLENGDESTMRYIMTMPVNKYYITNACEHPEVAFRIGDYMCDEYMTIWSRWGEKGSDWVEPTTPGMYEFMGYDAILEPVLQWGSVQNSHWQNSTPGFRRTYISLGMTGSDSSQKSKAIAYEMLYNRYGEDLGIDRDARVYKLTYTTDELDEKADIKNATDSYVNNMRYEFITGGKDIDSYWDTYIKELKGLNHDRLVEINQAAYDRMNDK